MALKDHSRWFSLADASEEVQVLFYEAHGYTQTYEAVGGSTRFRMMNGDGVKQSNWSRILTTISGSGCLPVALTGLDYDLPLTLKCGAPRHKASSSNVIMIPAEHRTDAGYEPQGFVLLGDFWAPQPSSLLGSVVTIDVHAQAEGYRVAYFPELSVLMDDPSESYDWSQAQSGWSLTAEQV